MSNTSIDISKVTSSALKAREFEKLFPEYYALASCTENSLWHDHQNVLDHVIGVFEGLEAVLKFEDQDEKNTSKLQDHLAEMIGSKSRLEVLKVATLLHDIAKVDTLVARPDGTAGCPGHELIAAGRVGSFAGKFDLDSTDQEYVERIVRYHGFISEILNLIIANDSKDKYLTILKETVGDVVIELILLMRADLLGSDLQKADTAGFDERMSILAWMLETMLAELS